MEPTAEALGLRRVMRQWATGVAVLTVREGDEVRGMTCNSLTSVTDSPPTILVSVLRGSRTNDMIRRSGRFAISILPREREDWSNRYAGVYGDLHEKFDDVPHASAPGGAPWLDGALGYFDCRVVTIHEVGTHSVFIAAVEVSEPGDEAAAPLVRFRSRYVSLDG